MHAHNPLALYNYRPILYYAQVAVGAYEAMQALSILFFFAKIQLAKYANVSPIGKALIGKHVGGKTTISAPAGEIELEITKIK